MSSVVPNPMTSSSAPTPARTRLPATAQPLAVGGGLEESEQRRAEIVDGSIHALGWHGAAVFLWEIDVVADQRLQREHLLAQRPDPRREAAIPLPQRRAPLRRGRGVHQVGNGLGLEQVDLAAEHGAAGGTP